MPRINKQPNSLFVTEDEVIDMAHIVYMTWDLDDLIVRLSTGEAIRVGDDAQALWDAYVAYRRIK